MNKQVKLSILFLSIILGIAVLIISENFQQNTIQVENIVQSKIPRAAIIDQLHNDKPNLNYQNNVTEYLSSAGYDVDLYTTDDITVDFYKKLPSMNYKFIVFRTHSLGDGTVEESASLFTGEIYTREKYFDEQFSGNVGKGLPYLPAEVDELGGWQALRNQTYFVVGSRLVDNLMIGTFPESTIILGGCETLQGTKLADSLLARGASEIIGWDGLVTSIDNDKVIIALLKETLVHDTEIENAIDLVMQKYDHTLSTPVTLKHFWSGASDLKG